MFRRKKKDPEAVGIHVGRSSLTLVRVVKHRDQAEVRQLFHVPLPRGLSLWPVDAVRVALAEAKRQVGAKVDEVRLTLPDDLAPSYFLMMPSLNGSELDSAIKFQLEGLWGNQAGELRYQSHVLEKRGDRCRVFCASIPMERLRLIIESFSEARFPIDAVEVEGVSAANLASRVYHTAPIAVLNICPDCAAIHVIHRNRIAVSRPIPRLEAASEGTDGSPANEPEPAPAERQQGAVGGPYLDRIVRESNKTLDYFEVELLSPPVKRMLLIGESASAPGLAEALSQRLEVTAEVPDLSESIADSTGEYDPARHSLAVAAAVGEEGHNEN